MASYHSLLQNALILDIETLGLQRGSGITEMAIYNLSTREATEWKIAPNMVLSKGTRPQDVVKLASTATDRHIFHPGLKHLGAAATWEDVVVARALILKGSTIKGRGAEAAKQLRQAFGGGKEGFGRALAVLKERDPWIYEQITNPNGPGDDLLAGGMLRPDGRTSQARMIDMQAAGSRIASVRTEFSTLEKALSAESHLSKEMSQNVTWIANANFESTQIGAHIAAVQQPEIDKLVAGGMNEKQAIRRVRQTHPFLNVANYRSPLSPDPTYVTGPEVIRARGEAAVTGDWKPVWKAYLKHTKAGDVRDIIDVLRARQSYAIELGLSNLPQAGQYGTSMDIAARLFGATELEGDAARKAFGAREYHRALEDAALTEAFVLEQGVKRTAVLQAVSEGTAEGRNYVRMYEQGGVGPLAREVRYQQLEHVMRMQEERGAVVKRLDRAFQDLATEGVTYQTTGVRKRRPLELVSKTGEVAHTARTAAETIPINRIYDVAEHLKSSGKYTLTNIDDVTRVMIDSLSKGGGLRQGAQGVEVASAEALKASSTQYVHANAKDLGHKYIKQVLGEGGGAIDQFLAQHGFGELPALPTATKRAGYGRVAEINKIVAGLPSGGRLLGAFAAGAGVIGAMQAVKHGPRHQRGGPESLRTMNYQNWLESQDEFYGARNYNQTRKQGLSPTGIAALGKMAFSDFGSPYRGPVYSQDVFQQQEILDAREKYMRTSFGAKHYDPINGLFGKIQNVWPSLGINVGHSFLTQDIQRADPSNFAGLKGKGLQKVSLSDGNWKVKVEDADTIVVQRGGIRGGIASFFGANKGYSFRLAGIDAPEVVHGNGIFDMKGSSLKSQPKGEAARVALEAMIGKTGKLDLVFDPSNMTYGRMVGAVIADGKNLNFELVRRGMAGALPFYKKGTEEMIDYRALGKLEKTAHGAQTGMWSEPFFQAAYDITDAAGSRITWNTFANMNKLVKNSSVMSGTAMMLNAQEQGFYSSANRIAAAEIGARISRFGFDGDARTSVALHGKPAAPHTTYMSQMVQDIGTMMKTQGGAYDRKLARSSGYDKYDKSMALDGLSTTNAIWSKRRLEAYNMYGVRSRHLRDRMATMQRAQNQQMFNSPIGHHRM